MPLIHDANEKYQEYNLDFLPVDLQRNSLKHYYLSVYPAIKQMRDVKSDSLPDYPDIMSSVYIHTPFCTGTCDFCSYVIIPINNARLEKIQKIVDIEDILKLSPSGIPTVQQYYDLLKKEILFHKKHTRLSLSYLYFGGGSPNLIPAVVLEDFFVFLNEQQVLNEKYFATIELHPEFFDNIEVAQTFITMLKKFKIGRVSIGYQSSDETILAGTNRRHTPAFLKNAIRFLRNNDILINIDLMYGLPNQSLNQWEETLKIVTQEKPDSISTYFLFLNKGTKLTKQVQDGLVQLPDYKHIQIQRLMAQIYLEKNGYYELPNDFFARMDSLDQDQDQDQVKAYRLPSQSHTLPIGVGAYGYYNDTQLCNEFDLNAYRKKIQMGRSPLWRAYTMNKKELLHRDIMFALKNDPYLDIDLFQKKYGLNIFTEFEAIFSQLEKLALVEINDIKIVLTPKGRLSVEEIACLFKADIAIIKKDHSGAKKAFIEKHDFIPEYSSSNMIEPVQSLSQTTPNRFSFFSNIKKPLVYLAVAGAIAAAGIAVVALQQDNATGYNP